MGVALGMIGVRTQTCDMIHFDAEGWIQGPG
jgi:hypothetical protein